MISPHGDYGARLSEEGFRWVAFPMDRRSVNPFREILVITRLALFYLRERPDVVHHFTVKCVVYGAIAAAFARTPARINAVAGLGYVFSNNSIKARLLRPLVRGLLRWSLNNFQSRLILQNPDDVKAFTLEAIVNESRVHLIRSSGVDTHRFQPRVGSNGFSRSTRVLLAARLLWAKGIAEYVQAARKLRSAGLPIRFLLAGAPDYGNPESLRNDELDALEAEGVIEVLGHVDNIPALLANTDIMVLPSYYGEGVPRSLIEAAACGLPIVTTDSYGCREVVTNGVNGFLIPVRNSAALAEAIQRLHENPEMRRELGANSRQRALADFDEKIIIEKTLSVYDELQSCSNQSGVFIK